MDLNENYGYTDGSDGITDIDWSSMEDILKGQENNEEMITGQVMFSMERYYPGLFTSKDTDLEFGTIRIDCTQELLSSWLAEYFGTVDYSEFYDKYMDHDTDYVEEDQVNKLIEHLYESNFWEKNTLTYFKWLYQKKFREEVIEEVASHVNCDIEMWNYISSRL